MIQTIYALNKQGRRIRLGSVYNKRRTGGSSPGEQLQSKRLTLVYKRRTGGGGTANDESRWRGLWLNHMAAHLLVPLFLFPEVTQWIGAIKQSLEGSSDHKQNKTKQPYGRTSVGSVAFVLQIDKGKNQGKRDLIQVLGQPCINIGWTVSFSWQFSISTAQIKCS